MSSFERCDRCGKEEKKIDFWIVWYNSSWEGKQSIDLCAKCNKETKKEIEKIIKGGV